MAKRSNPFVEDFIPQSKIHVGVKQFNNNEGRLEKVYEKTLGLLFRGAKKCNQGLAIETPDVTNGFAKDNLKQLFISKNGTLEHSGSFFPDKTATMQVCKCGSMTSSSCAYCELCLCASCQHSCAACEMHYCHRCSLLGSDGSEVCVSCCGH